MASYLEKDFKGLIDINSLRFNSNLTNAEFINCNLRKADFRNSKLKGIKLKNVNLHGVIGDGKYIKTFNNASEKRKYTWQTIPER